MPLLILLLMLLPLVLTAETLPESQAVQLIDDMPLLLKADSKLPRNASARVTFWVGKDGDVEAVELSCGERALFDEIVDQLLEFHFRGNRFITELSFTRKGKRVMLIEKLPKAQRPRRYGCDGQESS